MWHPEILSLTPASGCRGTVAPPQVLSLCLANGVQAGKPARAVGIPDLFLSQSPGLFPTPALAINMSLLWGFPGLTDHLKGL